VESDWSVAAGAEDPAIETRWSDTASGLAWVELCVDAALQRSRIAALPEATASPAMARALAMLNTPSGLLMTAKCDRWSMSEAELAELADVLDMSQAVCGYGSYIDVLMAHSMPMADFLLHEEWARMAARRCAALDVQDARVEMVVRPAHHGGVWGFGMSVYCYASGADAAAAEEMWSEAVDHVIPVVIQAAEDLVPAAGEIDT
jgi:hypothetical protein